MSVLSSGVEYYEPRNEIEMKMVNIIASELERKYEDVGIDDNFFDLGGTSLKMIKTKTFSRLALLSEILEQLEQEYQKVLLDGFADTFNAWREYSATLGNEIKVLGIEEQFSGKALDIDEDGALLVETEAGIKKVLAGDVSIRPK